MNAPETTFWDERYAADRVPWDQPTPPRVFTDFLKRHPAGRVLIPGCGSGYELSILHRAGWSTLGIDYSPKAVSRAQRILGPLAGLVRLGDFFSSELQLGVFDLVYERTFLCALPAERTADYGRRMAELVTPGGLLCGFFFLGPEDEPPPHPICDHELKRILENHFTRIEDQAVTDSLPLFANKERWMIWQRI